MANYVTGINASNTKTLVDLVVNVNDMSGNLFGLFLLIAVFLGYYLLFSKEQNINDLLTSSFLTLIVASLLIVGQMITWLMWIACFFIFIGILLVKFYS